MRATLCLMLVVALPVLAERPPEFREDATLVVTGASTGGEGGPKLSVSAARLMIALVLVGLVSGVLLNFAVKR